MFAQDYLALRLVRLKSPEGWASKPEGFSFVFLKGGIGKCIAGTVAQRVGLGDVAVFKGDAAGKLQVLNGEEVVFWSFSLSLEHLFPLFAGNELTLLQGVADGFGALKLYPASTPLAKECHRLIGDVPPQSNLDHRSQLLRVAVAILGEEFRAARGQRVGFIRVEDHMIRVFEKLSSNELLSLSVGELADKFGCSRRHLNRLFHQHFGFSVGSFRMEMRLLKAISLLRNPDAKIINVAEQCGFNHLGLFNTCFKKRFAVTPGQWRKKSQAQNQPAGDVDSCPLHANGLCPWSGKTGNRAAASTDALPYRKPTPAQILPNEKVINESATQQAVAFEQSGGGERLPRRTVPTRP